jgi:hypothetical protein
MFRTMLHSITFVLALSAALLALSEKAQAGPPLICHPFEIGKAQSLPWNGKEWRDVKRDYDLNRLVDDTLALLQADAHVLLRMETLRRATIYAVWAKSDAEVGYMVKDDKVANALLARLTERAKGQKDALALFDLGYFIESWKNATSKQYAPKTDGYALVKQAISLRNGDATMEFAAALMTTSDKTLQRAHLQKALAGARDGSVLAINLVSHFARPGQSLADLRGEWGLAKN